MGTSTDCNGNVVPDECESPDLNGNGLADFCQDCNGNLVPDWQDIQSGFSTDVNGNTIPDSCETLGDSNGDHLVNITDFLNVLTNWGPCSGTTCIGDVDFDGQVNVNDFLIVLTNWT